VICRAFRIIKTPPITKIIMSQKIICCAKFVTLSRFLETLVIMLLVGESPVVTIFESLDKYLSWLRNSATTSWYFGCSVVMFKLAGRGLPRSYFSNASEMSGWVVFNCESASSFEV